MRAPESLIPTVEAEKIPTRAELRDEATARVAAYLAEKLLPAAAGPGESDWRDQALCVQTDPEAFFPERGGSTREAKRVCRSCAVRAECLEYAIDRDERFGIWGGMTERERRRLKRQTG